MNKSKTLSRINLNSQQKAILEELTGVNIYLRNSFEINQEEISQLLEQGRQNAQVYLERNRLGQKLSLFEENNLFTAVVDLQKKLHLKNLPRHIECYDISHISGKFVYGSMVTFIDGKPVKKKYKLFKTKERNDDFANHTEVLNRRFKRALDFEILRRENSNSDIKSPPDNPWQLPNLLIIDGGKGQLSVDLKVLDIWKKSFEEQGLSFEVEICALAKKEEEVFLPSISKPVLVENQTKFLIQRIRDEAHRFAIINNRKARLKTAVKSELDQIDGIGQKTKQKLLSVFGSTKNLSESLFTNPELIYECVGKSITAKLKKHFGVIT